ncbi:S8 family serine peptidase [Roseiconus sp. JC912]|uniref:S8 family serine peptidase n=2 Tax=Pirellulaceae TaxID=2691357 RepID=UPI003A4C6603
MTSRQRKNSSSSNRPSQDNTELQHGMPASSARGSEKTRSRRGSKSRDMRRRHLLETLEQRQLLAGPQLIGIQPNEGELIVDGTVRDTSPRSLTFRFDENQQIDPDTLDAIQIRRAGPDEQFDTADDVRIQPGSVSLGALAENEVVVRFADALPDDKYRIDVFGFDAPNRSDGPIVGLQNLQGEFLTARDGVGDSEHVTFELRLGARVEAVVPQPVVRLSDRSLEQRRNEILVYFNDDELFVENDPTTGLPTDRSAENPRFYQLLLTQETVRTTDDVLFQPDRVVYDANANVARLIFADDLNALPGVPLSGGTFRLRVGTAVDRIEDLVVTPTELNVVPRVSSNLGIDSDLEVNFVSKVFGESGGSRKVRFVNSGSGGPSVSLDSNTGAVVYDFGGASVTVSQLRDIAQNTPEVDAVMSVNFGLAGTAGAGGAMVLPSSLVGSSLTMAAAGDTLTTALDIGVFGQNGNQLLSSITISESIDPQPYNVQLAGALTDPGRADAAVIGAINDMFGPDVTDGVTEIEYNFQSVFAGGTGTGFPAQVNNITEVQKRRVREALSLWANYLGLQFRETPNRGLTIALGSLNQLTATPNSTIRSVPVLDAEIRVDPTFDSPAIVFSNQVSFELDYGEEFFRKAMASIGLILGLDQSADVTEQTLMALDPEFLNGTINPDTFISPVDPYSDSQTAIQQKINPLIDANTIVQPLPNSLEGTEPVFPGRLDILHGQMLHRPDSVDVDLYRFEVALDAAREYGTLTVESFAERLADSSLLDTSLTLFQDVSATATSNFGLGPDLLVRFDSQLPGELGNRSRIEFIQTDRVIGDVDVRVDRVVAANGELVENAIRVDLPRRGPSVSSLTVGQVMDAINNDAFASTLFNVSVVKGSENAQILDVAASSYSPIRLADGGTVELSRNDDYFSNDSLLTARLENGIYYIGVAASGNDSYDPALSGSGYGGKTQGAYELLVKFEPQVSQTDVIRDRDSDRVGVPGTAIDGDLDGTPTGVHNFWFQTRPLDRILEVVSDGSGIVPGQTITVTGADGTSRRFEFVPIGSNPQAGNVAVRYSTLNTISNIASTLATAINSNEGVLGVNASVQVNSTDPLAPAQLVLTGERSLKFSANFQGVNALGRTIFVDKIASVVSDGSLDEPFRDISGAGGTGAFDAALPGDIVRIVGNGGQDNDVTTLADNFSYQIGLSEIGGNTLEDGRHMNVPKGVTTMIDAGALFKLRSATIGVGSNNLLTDRSGGALQVLGTPRLLEVSDPGVPGSGDSGLSDLGVVGDVVFTSTRDRAVDAAAAGNSPLPGEGNWGGIIFRSDLDRNEGRKNIEDEGIFMQVVNHADIRYGGGSNILINSIQQTVNPIQIVDLRPTVTFNRLTRNASAAMSASPDAFLETRFQAPRFQQAGAFVADYSRIGPDIKQNLVVDNSINGLFIRTIAENGQTARPVTVAAHIDDVDIVHFIAENVVLAGQPGGPIEDGFKPEVSSATLNTTGGGRLADGTYDYRMTFVDRSGFESLPSDPTASITASTGARTVQILNLPLIGDGSEYLTRRLYRLDPGSGEYRLIAELNRSEANFIDDGSNAGGAVLDLTRQGVRGRLNASLVIDPNTVIKVRGARLELGQGTNLIAEGDQGQRVVFTSALDDRFGAGGSFDTNEDAGTPGGGAEPSRGDWSGIYASPTANVSIDYGIVAYGGGVSLIEGGQTRGFAALELQQASARVTNSRFEYNDHGQDGSGPIGRNGRLAITPATIFGRFTQPIIADNQFIDNYGAIIDLDLASMTDEMIADTGRQTGSIDKIVGYDDNVGPLLRGNTTDSEPGNSFGRRQLNGLRIRGGELSGGSIWDDTDIAHVLFESVVVGNSISGSGLTLKSRPDESLVVKMTGEGTPNSATAGTGITATGSTGDIADRIGGTVHILGLPGVPVVLTSLKDDSVGAGRKTDGTAQQDTNGDGVGSRPSANDWRSLYLDGLSNDRNLGVVLEQELATAAPPGRNASANNAQVLGELAERLTASDDVARLGYEVRGYISAAGDIDTYTFSAVSGTQVWIDIDRTSLGLDSVIEILDDAGNVLARSDDSFSELNNLGEIDVLQPGVLVQSLGDAEDPGTERWVNGEYYDFGSTNLRDSGMRVTLPGGVGTQNDYYVRVRAASVDPDDIAGGATTGAYTFQVRLREEQEFPGSVVRYADIRYSNHGVHVQGLPGSSPLIGEAQENESADVISATGQEIVDQLPYLPTGGLGIEGEPNYPTDLYADNGELTGGYFGGFDVFDPSVLNSRPQNLGDLVDSKTGTISVGGQLSSINDVDFYQIDIDREGMMGASRRSTVFDIDFAAGFDRPDTNISVFYSPTGNPNQARLVLFGENSNVLDDQSSPLATELLGELLERGSISPQDPLIGPVSLPAGSYFVAITESTRIPTELNNNLVRRVPIDSTVRIFDDQVEVSGGNTAETPIYQDFVDVASSGWSVTTNRDIDLGHSPVSTFSSIDAVSPASQVSTFNSDLSLAQARASLIQDAAQGGIGGYNGDPNYMPEAGTDFRPDTIILAFNENVSAGSKATILSANGLQVKREFQTFNGMVVTTQSGADVLDIVSGLLQEDDILYAEPDYVREFALTPNDTRYGEQWHYNNTGQTFGTPDADIDLPEAWDVTTGSDQVVIAVIDSGLQLDHPDIVDNLWVNPGEIPGDGIDNDNNGYVDDINGIDAFGGDVDPSDTVGHGTHVAGTISATGNNNLGVTGVNWNAKIMPLQVGDTTGLSSAAIIEAIDYATMMRRDHGINIKVSNNSYGGYFPSFAEQLAVQAHTNAGILFVAAAGNDGLNIDQLPSYPASYPAAGVVSVAATDDDDQLAFFSNYGVGNVDLAAPGVNILSLGLNSTYVYNSGTSMASPHVAGVAALLAGYSPTASVQDLKDALMLGADPLQNLQGSSITGARLNAAGALAALPSGLVGNESYYFDRSEDVGRLSATAFNLTGYSAEDMPRFYFDYFVAKAGTDTITVQATSNEQSTPVELDIDLNDQTLGGVWRQAIIDLGDFAGNTGIVIEFVYETDINATAEGLYLDNFIVGFAERGELVDGATFGEGNFTAATGGLTGQYQLEVRPGTDYTELLDGGFFIDLARESAPRTVETIYLQLKAGRSIMPYDTLDVTVMNTMTGLDEVVRFQFQPSNPSIQNPAKVDPTAVAISFDRLDTESDIANRLDLAISTLTDYAFFDSGRTEVQLTDSFDTNDRHSESVTIVAPSSSQISEGSTFRLGDGRRTRTFEFTTDAAVTFGNIPVPYTPGASNVEIARSIIDVINSGVVQATLRLRASTVSGNWDFSNAAAPDMLPTDARIAIHGTAVGNFQSVERVADANTGMLPIADDGSLVLSAIYHNGIGDPNTVRTQGQVIIENNTITEVRAIGIWSDPGFRGTDPEDARSELTDPAGTNYIRMAPVGNSPLGGAINFPELNDSVTGGLMPGLVAQNNIIDRAGYTGIKADGDTRPFVLEWNDLLGIYASGTTQVNSPADIMIPDGFTFALDASGTRVVFEFEEVGGVPTNLGGSGVVGGDGFVDGHVPVYYRLGAGASTYNPSAPDPVRNIGSTVHEIMLSIYESVQGSILVSNGLVELVRPTLGPSLTYTGIPQQQAIDAAPITPRPAVLDPNYLDYATPALYLEGVTAIYASQAFQKQTGSGRTSQLNLNRLFYFTPETEIETVYDINTGIVTNAPAPMMPIAESPQPLVKLVNNTVRGSDGTEGAVLADGSLSRAIELASDEPNDTIFDAVDTKLEVSHRGAYTSTGTIGDNQNFLTADQDVDFFKVELDVGDRLIVDIDTAAATDPSTHVRVFDSSGIEVFVGSTGQLADYLNPGYSSYNATTPDVANGRDQFVDYTALKKDTYYVGVSSVGNESYEAKSLTERNAGTGGLGDYQINIEVLAPRSFVFSLDSHPLDPFGAEQLSGNINGTYTSGGPAGAGSLIGTTFTISQIPDYLIPTRPGDAYAGVNADGNRVTFEFTGGQNVVVLGNGNINVPILNGLLDGNGYRVPDIMRAISNAINGFLNNAALPNHSVGNGPNGEDGPIGRVVAHALGGSDGDNVGIRNMTRENGAYTDPTQLPFGIFGSVDFPIGFGHDRRESGGTANVVPNGTLTDSRGTTELYVLVENAAHIELSPEARAAGLKLGPDNTGLVTDRLGNTSFASESDQLLAEQGIYVGSGVSATILNNVVVNAHQSIVQEESSVFGFGGRIDAKNPDLAVKKGSVVSTGNTFQYDDYRNTQIRSDISWWVGFGGFVNNNFALDTGLSTDLRTGPSNVAGGNSDFNFVVRQPGTPGQSPGNFVTFFGDDLLEDGAAGRFRPAANSGIIDSAVDAIEPLVDLVILNDQLDIPTRVIAAPERDNSGQLRADEPTMAPPPGIGADVFKDRGALDRADFVGPVASLQTPLDNDFAKSDKDPALTFVAREDGTFTEFRVLVQDLGDESNPFVGNGIDPTTILVPPIAGLRSRGANITLFENERLLTEGVDYSFSYDETSGVISLRALAGVWRDDRAYRIELNNRDRSVLVAPESRNLADGDQISVIDSNGGTVIFEFETGYLLNLPEILTLEVPRQGTNQGGLIDGGVFTLDGLVFELDSNGTTVPGSIPVSLPTTPTPIDNADREVYLNAIAENIRAAIQGAVDNPNLTLDVDVRVVGREVLIGSEPGTTVDSGTSGLLIDTRTLSLEVPPAGADIGGVIVGETFTINDGNTTETFEFIDANTQPAGGNIGVDISAVGGTALDAQATAAAIINAIAGTGLRLSPELIGRQIFLGLPESGSASVSSGRLRAVGLSRTPDDGDLITVTPNDGGTPVEFEINRTDEPDGNGGTMDDGVAAGRIAINITRETTADQMSELVGAAIRSQAIAGLSADQIVSVGGGVLQLGGEENLLIDVSGTTFRVDGSPGVTGVSTLEIFGPLLMEVLSTAPAEAESFVIFDPNGNPINFEFDSDGLLGDPSARVIVFNRFDDQATIASAIVGAINGSAAGVTATVVGTGLISLGRIQSNRVIDTNTSLTTRRGIVSDGESITISQGGISVTYEFESVVNGGGVGQGHIPVPFQPGSTPIDVANSLAAAISSNSGGLVVDPQVTPEGLVELNDVAGTTVDVTSAASVILTGVPGGANAVNLSPADSPEVINRAILNAINSLAGTSPLTAVNRGGATLFIENARRIDGPIASFYLPAIKDLAGNNLAANRDDTTTQFTLLMADIPLDFGDAPDPRGLIAGRYPSLLGNDGARHVITGDLSLGSRVDAEPDAQVTTAADGDDLIATISSNGQLFATALGDGFASIEVLQTVDGATRDGDTVTLGIADREVTLEFDLDGIFAEENFAIAVDPVDANSVAAITEAIRAAVMESGLAAAEVVVSGDRVLVYSDDEDGVSFASDINPNGNLSKSIVTPITVTVSGTGILQAWIDFNADGDWDDTGEQIITGMESNAVFTDTGAPVQRTFNVTVPSFATPPLAPTATYARFRVSREGGLGPDGLAQSGEVEDYRVLLVSDAPPTLLDAQSTRTFNVQEDGALLALDRDGGSTSSTADDGLLKGIVDPNGDQVAIYSEDTGVRTLMSGDEVAGQLNISEDGTFTFVPEAEFNGQAVFTVRLTDVKPTIPESNLVSQTPLTVTINVTPVNDQPFATTTDVTESVQIDEDQSVIFTAEDLIDPYYVAGPANEINQTLIFQSVSSVAGGEAVSSLGGILEILPGGRSVRYTPPVDYNGSTPDTFNFSVADVPGTLQTARTADKQGTVSISILPVNDAPIARTDFYNAVEDTSLTIAVIGDGQSIVGILDNDRPGPQNEIDPPVSQTLNLPTDQFDTPISTERGGTVRFVNGALLYTPPGLYSGPDSFTYRVADNEGAESIGTVTIDVGGENDAPRFEGIAGEKDSSNQPISEITLPEAKPNNVSTPYSLDTWFSDPENDPLTYSVVSSDESVVSVSLDGSALTLTQQKYAFGEVTLTVVATDTSDVSTTQEITINIVNENDSPEVDPNGFGTITINEDEMVIRQLSDVFTDPDNDVLQYTITKLGSIVQPTVNDIANHPLIESISTSGGELKITPKPDQFGTVDIEIEATDGNFRVNDRFTLEVLGVADAPRAADDNYNLPIGSTLRRLNPSQGVLANDFDPDGDSIQVQLPIISQPTKGTLEINADGTFIYNNETGIVGDVDSFTYRVVDSTGKVSAVRTVTLTLNRSEYQNPIGGMEADVTADGFVSPIDALRIVNLIGRLGAETGAVPVSEIGTPPPDFYDVNGDGVVSASDALIVINTLALRQANGEGELVTSGESALSTSTSFAAASSDFLPPASATFVQSTDDSESEVLTSTDVADSLLAAGLEIDSRVSVDVDRLTGDSDGVNESSIDELLGDLSEDWDELLGL